MKKLFFALALLISVGSSTAQTSNRFDPLFEKADKAFDSLVEKREREINWEEFRKTVRKASTEAVKETNEKLAGNKYLGAAREAQRRTDKELANELAALRDVSGLDQIYAPLVRPQASSMDVDHNHELIPVLLDEFYDSARFYRIDYGKQISKLERIFLVKAPINFLGGVSKDGGTILLNADLAQYPNLMRVVLFRQFGKIYGLDEAQNGMAIMGAKWELNKDYETFAIRHRSQPYQKRNFFEKLQKKHGLKKQI